MTDERDKLAKAYRQTFRTDAGRVVLNDRAEFAGLASSGFGDASEADPLVVMAFAGRRRIVLRILALLEISELDQIANVFKSQKERTERRKKEGPDRG